VSKYLSFPEAVYKDRTLLVAALAALGYADVEEGEALPLFGYQGDRRAETAEIVVRRRYVGRLSNDIGFVRTPQGYVPLVSEYDDRTVLGGQLLVRLRTAYSEQVVTEVQRRLRGTARRTVEGSLVKIRVRF
jgi:hypothetical protein